MRKDNLFIPAGVKYTEFFKFIDGQLNPRSYFEIGTERGLSVRSFGCAAVCVDPRFKIEADVFERRSQIHFYQMTSDKFFKYHDLRQLLSNGPDICFLDGMHRCEYLLRDIINTERLCHSRSVVFLHDCIPVYPRMALRTHQIGGDSEGPFKQGWTGDVWKVLPILRKYRPDLTLLIFDCPPSGLVAISNLNPSSTELADKYSAIVDEMRMLELEEFTIPALLDLAPIISSRSLLESPEDLTLYLNVW